MKETKSQTIDQIAAKGEGITVPEGYFEDFAIKMAAKLPYREELDVAQEKQTAPKNSRWMRIRPYVYMAAMFAGAWCLIKMFSLMSPKPADVSIDNYPSLSLAIQHDDEFMQDEILDDVSVYDALDVYGENYYDEDDMYDYCDFDMSDLTNDADYILPNETGNSTSIN